MKDKLEIFKSLFKGRQDVFAIRWEKDNKSGYAPAYVMNWVEFRVHKEKGGSLKDFANKKYATLTDTRLTNHLAGKEIIGIYPLLQDNTSWFIAADFDETISKNKSWFNACIIPSIIDLFNLSASISCFRRICNILTINYFVIRN